MAHGCESPLVTTDADRCCSAINHPGSRQRRTGTPIGGSQVLKAAMTSSNAAAHRTECLILMRTSLVRQT